MARWLRGPRAPRAYRQSPPPCAAAAPTRPGGAARRGVGRRARGRRPLTSSRVAGGRTARRRVVARGRVADVRGGVSDAATAATASSSRRMSTGRAEIPADARTGPERTPVMRACGRVHALELLAAEREQAGDVRMRAEAAVPDADAGLGAQPRRNQGVGHALDDERGDRQRVDLEPRAEQAARRGSRPGRRAAVPRAPRRARRSAAIRGAPMFVSSPIAAASATAPRTLGEPASSRSGSRVAQITSTRSTR